ncbi:MAG: STAS domain-containing protein [Leptospira sp.]|nr:STAS domain-containing protein [Leptospira sp.]
MDNKVFSIQLKGGLDGANADDLLRFFETQVDKGFKSFLINFSSVDFITSSGISVLVKIHKQIRKQGLVYALYGIKKEVESVLRLIGLFTSLPVFPTISSAENFLQKTKPSVLSKSEEVKDVAPNSKESKQIRFYYSGNVVKQDEEIAKDPVSTLESLDDSDSQKTQNIENIPNPNLVEKVLEEKISELRMEIRDSLQEELEKRFAFFKENTKEEVQPVSLPKFIQSKSKQKDIPEKMIICESCNARLRITKIGFHKCPQCNTEFEMGPSGVLRFLEKLKT